MPSRLPLKLPDWCACYLGEMPPKLGTPHTPSERLSFHGVALCLSQCSPEAFSDPVALLG